MCAFSRIARMVRQPRGNALLVGVGGTGKQSLTRLASHMCGYKCFQIELTRGYNYESFHEDLKKLYIMTGVKDENTVFLFTDTQVPYSHHLHNTYTPFRAILDSRWDLCNMSPCNETIYSAQADPLTLWSRFWSISQMPCNVLKLKTSQKFWFSKWSAMNFSFLDCCWGVSGGHQQYAKLWRGS